MKGVPHVSRTDYTINKIRMDKEHIHETDHDAQVSVDADHWIPISLDVMEMAMLLSNTDPKLWKEAMTAYDAAEWTEGLREEMVSLQAHNVFTLILKSSVVIH